MKKIIGTTLLCLLHATVNAEVYKWVDENGKTRFSDKAPEEKPAQEISDRLKTINVDQASKNLPANSFATSANKTQDEEELEKKRKQQIENAIGPQCKKMHEDIQAIARGDRGIFLDENGKEELVLERDRSKKLDEWKRAYRKRGCEAVQPLE